MALARQLHRQSPRKHQAQSPDLSGSEKRERAAVLTDVARRTTLDERSLGVVAAAGPAEHRRAHGDLAAAIEVVRLLPGQRLGAEAVEFAGVGVRIVDLPDVSRAAIATMIQRIKSGVVY